VGTTFFLLNQIEKINRGENHFGSITNGRSGNEYRFSPLVRLNYRYRTWPWHKGWPTLV